MGRPADAVAGARFDRTTLGLLAVASAGAWVVTVRQADAMAMPGMGGAAASSWSVPAAAVFVAGWGVMMAAMMLPSAAPMIALYGTVARRRRLHEATAPTALFVLPYLLVWLALGLPVYVAATTLSAAVRTHPGLADAAPYAVAAVLVAAGGYQFSAIKRASLGQCQSPLSFLASRWRPGIAGALRVGFAHAGYCVGCCWALMVVLVAAGAMGLVWMLLVAVLVLAEKVLPGGQRTATAVGVVLVVFGVAVAAHPALATAVGG